jgi:hypothetical protein
MKRALQPHAQKIIAALFIAIFVVTAALSVRHQSSTWDDPFHIVAGASFWQTGDTRLLADHPPLARLLGSLPALFVDAPPVAQASAKGWESADFVDIAAHYLPSVEDRLLWPGRLCMLSLSILLGWLLYRWCSELHGENCAWFALALYAFCPVLLANAPLVTTDMAATTFFFASLYTWWRYARSPSPGKLAWASVSVAAAFASKHSALLLIPLLALLGIISIFSDSMSGSRRQRCRVIGAGLLAVSATTVIGLNLVYLFDGSMLTPPEYVQRAMLHPGSSGLVQNGASRLAEFWPAWLPVPLPFYYVCGVLELLGRVDSNGHATYFLGQAGLGGWPNYFPVLLLVKLSIPMLLLIAAGIFQAISRLSKEWWNLLFIVSPIVLLVYAGSAGKMQIGFRHILPVVPFLLMLAAYAIRWYRTRTGWFAAAALLIWNEGSSLEIHPDYLMYFNFIGGGADQGWRISVTGDDYGQGDAELLRWLQARNVRVLNYGGFGWGNAILNRAGIATKTLPCADTGELTAAHIGSFLIAYTPDGTRCYDWMRQREPDAKIGYNIFIYNAGAASAAEPAAP